MSARFMTPLPSHQTKRSAKRGTHCFPASWNKHKQGQSKHPPEGVCHKTDHGKGGAEQHQCPIVTPFSNVLKRTAHGPREEQQKGGRKTASKSCPVEALSCI